MKFLINGYEYTQSAFTRRAIWLLKYDDYEQLIMTGHFPTNKNVFDIIYPHGIVPYKIYLADSMTLATEKIYYATSREAAVEQFNIELGTDYLGEVKALESILLLRPEFFKRKSSRNNNEQE